MAITKMIAGVMQYISEAFLRIFGPTDDDYPTTGVQPFTGRPYKKRTADIW